jgi:hypothetical protein
MAVRRALQIGFLFAAVVLALLIGLTARAPISDEEIGRRIAESRPAWSNYDEDLKAQLGATPVAEWEGEPADVRWESGAISVVFELSGPWAERESAIPVLIELPTGETIQNDAALREGVEVVYRFSTPLKAPPRWIAVRYPFYGERRIVLSDEGKWRSTED